MALDRRPSADSTPMDDLKNMMPRVAAGRMPDEQLDGGAPDEANYTTGPNEKPGWWSRNRGRLREGLQAAARGVVDQPQQFSGWRGFVAKTAGGNSQARYQRQQEMGQQRTDRQDAATAAADEKGRDREFQRETQRLGFEHEDDKLLDKRAFAQRKDERDEISELELKAQSIPGIEMPDPRMRSNPSQYVAALRQAVGEGTAQQATFDRGLKNARAAHGGQHPDMYMSPDDPQRPRAMAMYNAARLREIQQSDALDVLMEQRRLGLEQSQLNLEEIMNDQTKDDAVLLDQLQRLSEGLQQEMMKARVGVYGFMTGETEGQGVLGAGSQEDTDGALSSQIYVEQLEHQLRKVQNAMREVGDRLEVKAPPTKQERRFQGRGDDGGRMSPEFKQKVVAGCEQFNLGPEECEKLEAEMFSELRAKDAASRGKDARRF